MNKLLIAGMLVAIMATGSVYAKGGVGNRGHSKGISQTRSIQKAGKAQKKNTAAKLNALDRNGDNNVTRDEASKKLDRRFEKIDTDGNNNLSTDELKALKKSFRTKDAVSSSVPTAANGEK